MMKKDIPSYEELYQIDEKGNVYSIKSNIIRKTFINNSGYKCVQLHKRGVKNTYLIHRLVAGEFIDNRMKYEQVNHIDGNKFNNDVNNLEWSSASQNMQHAYDTGLSVMTDKRKAHMKNIGHLSPKEPTIDIDMMSEVLECIDLGHISIRETARETPFGRGTVQRYQRAML